MHVNPASLEEGGGLCNELVGPGLYLQLKGETEVSYWEKSFISTPQQQQKKQIGS